MSRIPSSSIPEVISVQHTQFSIKVKYQFDWMRRSSVTVGLL